MRFRCGNARNYVRAEGGLGILCRQRADVGVSVKVICRNGNGGRADINGNAKLARGGACLALAHRAANRAGRALGNNEVRVYFCLTLKHASVDIGDFARLTRNHAHAAFSAVSAAASADENPCGCKRLADGLATLGKKRKPLAARNNFNF